MHYLKVFLVALPAFIAVDFLWIGVLMGRFYKAELGPLARRSGETLTPIWPAAIVTYLLIVGGLMALVLPQLDPRGSLLQAAVWGGLFGLVLCHCLKLVLVETLGSCEAVGNTEVFHAEEVYCSSFQSGTVAA